MQLMNGRARRAQEYPVELCRAFVRALRAELEQRDVLCEVGGEEGLVDELHEETLEYQNHFDENTDKHLDPSKVKQGRERELKKLQERQVYVHVSRDEARANPKGKFIKTRWVEIEKGDEVRCRFVAKEFAAGDPRTDLFAGTPRSLRLGWWSPWLPPGAGRPGASWLLTWAVRSCTPRACGICTWSYRRRTPRRRPDDWWASWPRHCMGRGMLLSCGWRSLRGRLRG